MPKHTALEWLGLWDSRHVDPTYVPDELTEEVEIEDWIRQIPVNPVTPPDLVRVIISSRETDQERGNGKADEQRQGNGKTGKLERAKQAVKSTIEEVEDKFGSHRDNKTKDATQPPAVNAKDSNGVGPALLKDAEPGRGNAQAQGVARPDLSPEIARLEERLAAGVPSVLKSRAEHDREEKLELQEMHRLSRLELMAKWREKWQKIRAALDARDQVASLSEADPSTDHGDVADSPESQRVQRPTFHPVVSRTTPTDSQTSRDKPSTFLPPTNEDRPNNIAPKPKMSEMERPAAPVASSTATKSGKNASSWADEPDPPASTSAVEESPPPPKPSRSESLLAGAPRASSEREHSAPVTKPRSLDGEAERANQPPSSERVPQKRSGLQASRWADAPASPVDVEVVDGGVSVSQANLFAFERTIISNSALTHDGSSVQPPSTAESVDKAEPQWDKLLLPSETDPHWSTSQSDCGESLRDVYCAKASEVQAQHEEKEKA